MPVGKYLGGKKENAFNICKFTVTNIHCRNSHRSTGVSKRGKKINFIYFLLSILFFLASGHPPCSWATWYSVRQPGYFSHMMIFALKIGAGEREQFPHFLSEASSWPSFLNEKRSLTFFLFFIFFKFFISDLSLLSMKLTLKLLCDLNPVFSGLQFC